ncbi:hypothetical protein MSG28_005310 [Choristoneura fumiferana]|uniref:Uncharacterized protein n=1 Tax=Choristoneura fumiferana TaxID=7141 RepID=A0ACC0JR57_CHOFU|nr:hypothetical protein MSG28_005310 [Choristoneura fumiferana]
MFHSILLQVLLSSLLIINSVASQCTKVQDCVSDLKETGCKTGETLQHDPEILFGCCPVCLPGTPEAGKCRPPANCLQDGSYAPVQCKGDLFTGRCFCSDKSGNRIFGQMWKSEAAGMTCDSAIHMGESYLRRCESIVQALDAIHKEQSNHGTKYLSNSKTICDYDGSYGSYKIEGTSAYCTGRDGSILGPWSVEANNIAGMNCNCARDTSMYFPDHGMIVVETCESNGNYKTKQNIGDYWYCVDSDGYTTDCTSRR